MLKLLFLAQKDQIANLDALYTSIQNNSQCDLHYLDSDQQGRLKNYLKRIDTRQYDFIILMTRAKKAMKQISFLKKIENLVFLEHDACQNYMQTSKYCGKFSAFYKKLPKAIVISSGYTVTGRLKDEGINAYFIPKGYDQKILFNIGQPRNINLAFIGSTKNSLYRERAEFLNNMLSQTTLKILRTDKGGDYRDTLNRISIFVSADINFGEHMAKNFEAMACGCVVCAFDQGEEENLALGFQDMENIVLYKNSEELLNKVHKLQTDHDLCEHIRQEGEKLATLRYQFSILGKQLVKLLASRP